MSSILVFRRVALPALRYLPNDIELALGMTLLKLHYILQVFCVRQEDGEGVNRGSYARQAGGILSRSCRAPQDSDQSSFGFLLFFTFSAVVGCFFRCFVLLCEIGRLLDPKSEIGKSFASKAESSGEDPRATGGLVFNLSHPWVNKTKQHTRVPRNLRPRAHFSHFGVTNSPL